MGYNSYKRVFLVDNKRGQMRKVFLVVFFSLFICSVAFAASTADITVRVTVRFLSVSVDMAEYDFGFMDAGEVKLATSAITAKNESNCAVNFSLKLTNPGGWTAVSEGIPVEDKYMLSAIFRTSSPISGDYGDNDAMTINFVVATETQFAKTGDAEGEKGYNVAADATRKLWLRFYAPSATIVKTQQLIPITVKAVGY